MDARGGEIRRTSLMRPTTARFRHPGRPRRNHRTDVGAGCARGRRGRPWGLRGTSSSEPWPVLGRLRKGPSFAGSNLIVPLVLG